MKELYLIPLVGELRATVLQRAGIDSIERLLKTPIEVLAELDGFSIKIAQKIRNYASEIDRRGLKGKEPIKELIIPEFRCPRCKAIVSKIESSCHRCNLVFGTTSREIEESIVQNHFEILISSDKAELWRDRANFLENAGLYNEASVCNMKAELLEIFGEEKIKPTLKNTEREKRGFVDNDGVILSDNIVGGIFSTEMKRGIWKGVIIFLLLMLTTTSIATIILSQSLKQISIDGKFSDWVDISPISVYGTFLKEVRLTRQEDKMMMYMEFHTKLFESYILEVLGIFLDVDLRSSTGYGVGNIGADGLIMLNRSSLEEYKAPYMVYIGKHNRWEWKKMGMVKVYGDGKRVELAVHISKFYGVVVYRNESDEFISSVFSTEDGIFCVATDDKNREIYEGDVVCSYTLISINGKALKSEIKVMNEGTAKTARFRLISEDGKLIYPGVSFYINKHLKINVIYDGGGNEGDTIYLRPSIRYLHTLKDLMMGKYIKKCPEDSVFDGIYADWKYLNDSYDCSARDYDIENVGVFRLSNQCVLVSFCVRGELFKKFHILSNITTISIELKLHNYETGNVNIYELKIENKRIVSMSKEIEVKYNDKYIEIMVLFEIDGKYVLEVVYQGDMRDSYIHDSTALLAS